jgi:hypothetical protein
MQEQSLTIAPPPPAAKKADEFDKGFKEQAKEGLKVGDKI